MATINLKDFYYWQSYDEFIEVSDEIVEELFADKRYERAYQRRTFYNKAHYSLNAEDGIEASALIHHTDNPEEIFTRMDKHCVLCQALNSLPETQGKRIEAHFILGKSQAEIAEAEGITKGPVSISIKRGLTAMKKFLKNSDYM